LTTTFLHLLYGLLFSGMSSSGISTIKVENRWPTESDDLTMFQILGPTMQ